jgi:hypothetical protein
LNRDITITEKLDGTNAAVVIVPWGLGVPFGTDANRIAIVAIDGVPDTEFHVFAQSRTRFITPKQDNYGFAGWVHRNAEALVETLGEGTHFGEWWGSGIQRKYGLTGGDKRFSLFNTKRWGYREDTVKLQAIPGLGVVPVLYEGPFDQDEIDAALTDLRFDGSSAAEGFMKPEGIVIFHHASREMYKVTLEGDEAPKGAAGHALDEERIAA